MLDSQRARRALPLETSPVPVGQGEHVVQPGEGMSKIAEKHGFFWQTLWNNPANSDLRNARQNPEVLLPGDRVTIPKADPGHKTVTTGKTHRFRLKGVPVRITFQLSDPAGTRFAGKDYLLEVGTRKYTGKTNSEGCVDAWIAPSASTGRLTVKLDTPGYPKEGKWTLQIGFLEPIDSPRGVEARLNNLGYRCEGEDGNSGQVTSKAIRAFQRDQGLEPTGTPDDRTQAALLRAHGL